MNTKKETHEMVENGVRYTYPRKIKNLYGLWCALKKTSTSFAEFMQELPKEERSLIQVKALSESQN